MTEESKSQFDSERERLEIEKQKLALEKEKFEFEKTKHNSLKETQPQVKNNSRINIVAIVLGIASILTVFLPWVKGDASGSVSAMGQNYSSSYSSGAISGIVAGEGLLSVILLAVGIIFNFKGNRISAAFGTAAFLLTIIFFIRMQAAGTTISSYNATGSFRMNVMDGWFYSALTTLLYSILSIFNLGIKGKTPAQLDTKTKNIILTIGLSFLAFILIGTNNLLVSLIVLILMFNTFQRLNFINAKYSTVLIMLGVTIYLLLGNILFRNSDSEILRSLRYEFTANGFYFLKYVIALIFAFSLVIDGGIQERPINIFTKYNNRKYFISFMAVTILWPIANCISFTIRKHEITLDEKKHIKEVFEKTLGNEEWYILFQTDENNVLPASTGIWFYDRNHYTVFLDSPNKAYADMDGNFSYEVQLKIDSMNKSKWIPASLGEGVYVNLSSFTEDFVINYKDTSIKFPLKFRKDKFLSGEEIQMEIISVENDTLIGTINYFTNNTTHEFKYYGIKKSKFDALMLNTANVAKIESRKIYKDLKLPDIHTGNQFIDNKLKRNIVYLGTTIEKLTPDPEKTSGWNGDYIVNYNANGILSLTFTSEGEECNYSTLSLKTGELIKYEENFKQDKKSALISIGDSIFQKSVGKIMDKYHWNQDSLKICYSNGSLFDFHLGIKNLESFIVSTDCIILKDVVCFSNIKEKVEVRIPFDKIKEFVTEGSQLSFILKEPKL